jgi:hypothetical protein
MLTTLNIVIGIVFVLLLFSLLATAVLEVLATALSLRARHLRHTLENMLGEKMDAFVRHPLFRQCTYAANYRQARPSAYHLPAYLSRQVFATVLHDVLYGDDPSQAEARLQNMEEGDAKRMLQYLLRRASNDSSALRAQAELWFDEVMQRSTDWYRRSVKWWLFGIGLALALLFNVDTVQMYHSISSNTTTQRLLVELASDFAAQTATVESGDTTTLTLDQAVARVDSALQRIEYIRSPLGLGWYAADSAERAFPWWLSKLLGWLLTAVAVTLGAPFWFDLLRMLLGMRRSSDAGPPSSTGGEAAPRRQLPARAASSNPVG